MNRLWFLLCALMLLTAAAGSSAFAQSATVLEPQWSVDSDQNKVPDFIEQELGFNPKADDCALDNCGNATLPEAQKQTHKVLIILDVSGSMAGQVHGEMKLAAAKRAVNRYATSLPEHVEMGLMVYGHRGGNSEAWREESCQAIELLADFGAQNQAGIEALITPLKPTGWTPIADSLHIASRLFEQEATSATDTTLHHTVVLVTDGIETCDGDPVSAAEQLHSRYGLVVDVVGFDIQKKVDIEALQAVAQAGGGQYADARAGTDLEAYFEALQQSYHDLIALEGCTTQVQTGYWNCDRDFVNRVRAHLRQYQQRYRQEGNRDASDAVRKLGTAISEARIERSKQNYDRSNERKDSYQEQREHLRAE